MAVVELEATKTSTHSDAVDVSLMRLLKKKDNYDKYIGHIKNYTLLPQTAVIVADIGEYFKHHPEATEVDWTDFRTWFRVSKHPGWKTEQHILFDAVLENVASKNEVPPGTVERFIELDYATKINEQVQLILRGAGTGGLESIKDIISDVDVKSPLKEDKSFVSVDADALTKELWIGTGAAGPGLEWRLEDLNRSVGPLRRGDLVFIGKRPEVGGTTFVCSEFTHMVTQLPEGKHAIIFNNEEIGSKVGLRLIQAGLGYTVSDIVANPANAQEEYKAILAGRTVDVYHNTSLSISHVDRVLKAGKYGLIAINVLMKVQGFPKKEGIERLEALSGWARKLADKYGVVFVVVQADASAEGVRYLDQSQLYYSKTGMQGEADVQLMIGKDPTLEDRRFFSVVKNKTLGGPRTIPAMKHGRFEVLFDSERARFHTISWV